MGFVAAKCPQCGANIEVDSTKDAGICKYCGTPFVTEKVINQYQVNNTTNNYYIGKSYGNDDDKGKEKVTKAQREHIDLALFYIKSKDNVNADKQVEVLLKKWPNFVGGYSLYLYSYLLRVNFGSVASPEYCSRTLVNIVDFWENIKKVFGDDILTFSPEMAAFFEKEKHLLIMNKLKDYSKTGSPSYIEYSKKLEAYNKSIDEKNTIIEKNQNACAKRILLALTMIILEAVACVFFIWSAYSWDLGQYYKIYNDYWCKSDYVTSIVLLVLGIIFTVTSIVLFSYCLIKNKKMYSILGEKNEL